MSKNLSRKGIALGAGLALVGTALTTTPAFAAGVTLAASAGTGTSTILGETFTLKATIDSSIPSTSYDQLKFAITNTSAAALTLTADYGTAAGTDVERTQVVGDAANYAASDASSATSAVVYGATANAARTAAGAAGAAAANQTLAISTTATTATSVNVVAFLDADGEGDLDAGEYQTAATTVSFVKAADAGITVAWTPQIGDATVKAKVTSSVINVAQINADHIDLQFGKYISGTATKIVAATAAYGTLTASATAGVAVTLNTAKTALETAATNISFTDSAARTAINAGSYVLQALFNLDPAGTAWVKVGSELSVGATAAVVDGTESSVALTAGENVLKTGEIRDAYKGDVVISVSVKDEDKAALAGKVVRLTTGTLVGTYTVNGVSAASSTEYNATSNASGVATFTIASSTASASGSNVFDIDTIKSEGVSITDGLVDLTWTAVTYTVTEKANFASADLKRATTKGGSVTFNFVVVDNWKKVLSDAKYRVKAVATVRTTSTQTDDLSDGAASFTIGDGGQSSATATTTVTPSVEELASGVWGAVSSITVNAISARTVYYYDQTDKVTLNDNGTGSADLSARSAAKKLVAVDTRLSTTAAASIDASGTNSDEEVNITGTVTNSVTEAAKDGVLVTVSGPSNVLFNVGDTYAFGSLTFYDADATLAIKAYSNVAQSNSVVTVASGAVSKTVKISFVGGPTNVGTAITFAGSTIVKSGATLAVASFLKDTYGNAVDTDITATDWNDDNAGTADDAGESDAEFTLEYDGPGFVLNDLPVATSSTGKASFTVLLGANDHGVATVTATYGGADGVIGTGDDDVTATKTILVGISASIIKAATSKVTVKNALGATVKVVRGTKSVTKTATSDSFKVSLKGGTGSVKVYVNGIKVASK